MRRVISEINRANIIRGTLTPKQKYLLRRKLRNAINRRFIITTEEFLKALHRLDKLDQFYQVWTNDPELQIRFIMANGRINAKLPYWNNLILEYGSLRDFLPRN